MITTLEQEAEALLGECHLNKRPDYIWLTDAKSLTGDVAGYKMVEHAQAWVDDCRKATGAKHFGTYPGHSPTTDRAVDTFSPVPGDRRAPGTPGLSRVLGDDIADFSLESIRNGNPYGIDYVIWRQHIFNIDIADYWRWMSDRSGVTNNHFDHNHNSFDVTASGVIVPKPSKPSQPITKENAMALSVRFIHDPDEMEIGRVDWVFDGPSRIFAPVGVSGVLKAADACKFPELGEVDRATYQWFKDAASMWGQDRD